LATKKDFFFPFFATKFYFIFIIKKNVKLDSCATGSIENCKFQVDENREKKKFAKRKLRVVELLLE